MNQNYEGEVEIMSNEYSNLSLTEINKQIHILEEVANSRTITYFILLTFLLVCIGIVIISIFVIQNQSMLNIFTACFLTVIFSIVSLTLFIEKNEATKDIEVLREAKSEIRNKEKQQELKAEKEYLTSISNKEVKSMEIEVIKNNVQVEDKLCPSLKTNEQCYFVSYLNGGDTGQTIVPFNEKEFQKEEGSIYLNYYNLSNEELKLYIASFKLTKKKYGGRNLLPDSFSLGDSLTK